MAQETVDAQTNAAVDVKERQLRQKANQLIRQSQVRRNAFIKPGKTVERPGLARQVQEALRQQLKVREDRQDERYVAARDFASESAELIKAATERNRQELISAVQRIDQERQAEFDRQNVELKRRFENFLKNIDKNLPQKGQHKDYSVYNNNFKPIVRK